MFPSSTPGLAAPALSLNGESSGPALRESIFTRWPRRWRLFNLRFPTILDDYVLRDFALYLSLIVATFLMLLLVFTLFELLNDILRNHVSVLAVGEYLLNVTPYFLYYPIAPLSMLLAVPGTLRPLPRSHQITALKTNGISLFPTLASFPLPPPPVPRRPFPPPPVFL